MRPSRCERCGAALTSTKAWRRLRWRCLATAYKTSSLEALLHLRPIAVTLQLSGVPTRDPATGERLAGTASESQLSLATEVLQLAVVNTPLFGAALKLRLPGVDARDQLLDVVLIEPPRLDDSLDAVRAVMGWIRAPLVRQRNRRLLSLVSAVHRHRQQEREDHTLPDLAGDVLFPGIRRYQARPVAIETATAVDLTLDGEVRTRTPAVIRVAPTALAVLLPRAENSVLVGGNTGASITAPNEMPS